MIGTMTDFEMRARKDLVYIEQSYKRSLMAARGMNTSARSRIANKTRRVLTFNLVCIEQSYERLLMAARGIQALAREPPTRHEDFIVQCSAFAEGFSGQC
jgi:hypothetical protein